METREPKREGGRAGDKTIHQCVQNCAVVCRQVQSAKCSLERATIDIPHSGTQCESAGRGIDAGRGGARPRLRRRTPCCESGRGHLLFSMTDSTMTDTLYDHHSRQPRTRSRTLIKPLSRPPRHTRGDTHLSHLSRLIREMTTYTALLRLRVQRRSDKLARHRRRRRTLCQRAEGLLLA